MRSRVFPLAIIALFTPAALQTPRSTQAALASASQNRDPNKAPEACPVTQPPAQPFVPPPPYWTRHNVDQFWYGTESLWTLLSVQGKWHIHEGERGYSLLTYWRRGWRREHEPALIVVAKRLDREAPTVTAGPAYAVFVNTERPGMMTGIDIPSTGCWEFTAQYSGQRLSFVVSAVQP